MAPEIPRETVTLSRTFNASLAGSRRALYAHRVWRKRISFERTRGIFERQTPRRDSEKVGKRGRGFVCATIRRPDMSEENNRVCLVSPDYSGNTVAHIYFK